jgi:hypothetical protein
VSRSWSVTKVVVSRQGFLLWFVRGVWIGGVSERLEGSGVSVSKDDDVLVVRGRYGEVGMISSVPD